MALDFRKPCQELASHVVVDRPVRIAVQARGVSTVGGFWGQVRGWAVGPAGANKPGESDGLDGISQLGMDSR